MLIKTTIIKFKTFCLHHFSIVKCIFFNLFKNLFDISDDKVRNIIFTGDCEWQFFLHEMGPQ